MTPPSMPPEMTQHITRVDAQYAQIFAVVRASAPDATAHLQFIKPFQFLTVDSASPIQPPPLLPSCDNHTRADGDDDDDDMVDIGS